MSVLTLYRAEPAQSKSHNPLDRRPPQNVPYVVDNLWEWARPTEWPSRRGCEYASPDPVSALKSAGNKPGLHVFGLYFKPGTTALQIAESDAKEHSDIKPNPSRKMILVKALFELLKPGSDSPYPSWASQPLPLKLAAAPLFLPVLSRDELDALLGAGGPLAGIAKQLRKEVAFWSSAKLIDFGATGLPNGIGEVFFQAGSVERKELVEGV